MVSILRRVIAVLALAAGIGVAAGTASAAAATTHSSRSSVGHVTVAKPNHQTGLIRADDWWF
jgi:hypothetical protein